MRGISNHGAVAIAALLLATATPVAAQDAARDYRIAEQELGSALRAFAIASNREVVADTDLLVGKRARRVVGQFDPSTALRLLLAGTGLTAELVDGAFVVRPDGDLRDDVAAAQAPAQDIVVTGTRIRGAAPAGAPVTVVDRTAIERSGRGTIQSLLETIPANFGGGANEQTVGANTRGDTALNPNAGSSINLRGLGANSTLVLFDGNRPALAGSGGTFADVSLIPQLAIERIEILTDGASALYGSDAVAGVVNFRFRNRFDGAETFLRAGTADGDFGEQQLGQLLGRRWSSGGVTLAYQFSARDALRGDERRFSTENLRPFGGPDDRSTFAAPGTIVAADGRVFAIPARVAGRLRPSDLVPGATNRRDARRSVDLLPAQRTHAFYGAVEQDLFDSLSAYARVFWARRSLDTQRTAFIPSPVVVPSTNAFYVDPIGSGLPVVVQYDFAADLGPQRYRGASTGLLGIAGVSADLGAWRAELNGSWGAQTERTRILNIVNSTRLAAALADANPATAYDVFGGGGSTSAATIARVRGSYNSRARYEVWTAAARADGPLFRWAAGTVRLAAGYEHRRERLAFRNLVDIGTDGIIDPPVPGLPASRDVDAVYGELLVPLAGEDAHWLPGTLELSLAGRVERYSDFGHTANPKAGLAWQPLSGLTLRGSYGRSFRAPNFLDLAGAANSVYGTLALPDPQSPTGTSNTLVLFGYAPGIGPERATSWTGGVDWRNLGGTGLDLSLTYFRINYRDRIGSVESDFASFLVRRDLYGGLVTETPNAAMVAGFYAAPSFFNLISITPGQVEKIVDARTRNLSTVRLRGLDGDLRLTRPLSGGTGQLALTATRLLLFDERVTELAPRNNVVATVGRPVKLRLRGEAGWSRGGFDGRLFVNYTGGYTNQLVQPAERVGAWTTLDLQLGYAFGASGVVDRARIAIAATNLLDRDPPYIAYVQPTTTLAFDPEQASPAGRVLSVQMTLAW